MAETVTLQLPSRLYQRLVNTAQDTKRPLEEIIIHSLDVGSPPDWEDVPEEFQADLAALDRLDDDRLWQITSSVGSQWVASAEGLRGDRTILGQTSDE